MSVFDNIIKKFKKEKVEQNILKPVTQKEIDSGKFDFETNEQSELLLAKQKQGFSGVHSQEPNTIYDLNDIFWVFIETQHKNEEGKLISLDVKAVPIKVVPGVRKAYDLIDGKEFLMEDVTKGDSLINMRAVSDDMALFSVKVAGIRYNYGIRGTGEYYDLKGKEPVDSYNAGAPALINLMKKSFATTDFSSIFKEDSRGFALKDEALITHRDILKLNDGLEKIYKQERLDQNEKFHTTYRRDFI